jgi:predicted Zn-dependent peptidase
MRVKIHVARLALGVLLAWPLLAGAVAVRLPEYSRDLLPNGVVLDVMERRGVPLVEIYVAVRGGMESDPVDQAGLAHVTASLLRQGTIQHSSDQFSEVLDGLGGEFETHANAQSTIIRSEFLAKDFLAGLALVSEAVLHPVFPEEETHKLLAQQLDSIKVTKDDSRHAVRQYARAFFFGTIHPYGRVMDEASITRMNRASIAGYHDRFYVDKNLIIAVVGDIDSRKVKAAVQETFGRAAGGDSYVWQRQIVLKNRAQSRLLLVDKPGATQTHFMIVQPGISAKDADRVPLELVNTLFGGRFTSMLNKELRVKSGLSYGATNHIDEDRMQGMNAISTFTKTDSTGRAIDLALKTLAELREKGVTADQLESAKAYVKGLMPRRMLESSDQLAAKILRLEILGFGRDEIDTLFQRIDAVTVAEANAVIRKNFQTTGLTILVIGDAARIRDQVKPFASQTRELPIVKAGFGN